MNQTLLFGLVAASLSVVVMLDRALLKKRRSGIRRKECGYKISLVNQEPMGINISVNACPKAMDMSQP